MTQKVATPKAKKVTKTVSGEQQIPSKTIPVATLSSSATPTTAITAEQRHQLIAEAAYAIAEQRGFKEVAAMDDWLQAEAKVDSQIAIDNVR